MASPQNRDFMVMRVKPAPVSVKKTAPLSIRKRVSRKSVVVRGKKSPAAKTRRAASRNQTATPKKPTPKTVVPGRTTQAARPGPKKTQSPLRSALSPAVKTATQTQVYSYSKAKPSSLVKKTTPPSTHSSTPPSSSGAKNAVPGAGERPMAGARREKAGVPTILLEGDAPAAPAVSGPGEK